ncbi:MAG: M28 family peptidase [bacterium]|nr:M28 family peptidase [bacterium]
METQITTAVEKNIRTGYKFLREMCSFNADFNAFIPRINPITNRVNYIQYQLKQMNVPFETDIFNADNPEKLNMDKPKYVNVYAFFKGSNPSNETIVFLAHHDIANIESENCQDNTASVCNLLHLCEILRNTKLNKNVLVAFTDAEEIVSPETCGAKRLAILTRIGMFGNVFKAINLELTANGECLWLSTMRNFPFALELSEKYNGQLVETPYNDAFVLELNGLTSVCIGTLTENELYTTLRNKPNFCRTWGLCHTDFDTISNANAEDMKRFVENILVKMCEV